MLLATALLIIGLLLVVYSADHNIFTESYLHRLAKAGICFTFGTHKVKIKNSLRCVGITQRGDDYT
ncbi:hypothetical protein CKQ90_29520 [Klebsiella pneumoniae]|nr:hypothetical protein CKQ90_29520 [Klebsiella pneumoniae]